MRKLVVHGKGSGQNASPQSRDLKRALAGKDSAHQSLDTRGK